MRVGTLVVLCVTVSTTMFGCRRRDHAPITATAEPTQSPRDADVETPAVSGPLRACSLTGRITREYVVPAGCSTDVDDVEIDANAVLTIEAGATLRFARDAALTVNFGATLRVAGSAASPTRLTGRSSVVHPGEWAGIVSSGSLALEHAIIEGAGAVRQHSHAAVTHGIGHASLRHVTIRKSSGAGISAPSLDAFDAFEDVRISDSRPSANLSPGAVGSLGSGTFDSAIETLGRVERAVSWRAIGAPIEITPCDSGVVGVEIDSADGRAVLAIAPGVQVRAGPHCAIGVDNGRLEANGVSFSAREAALGWAGIGISTRSTLSIEGATIEGVRGVGAALRIDGRPTAPRVVLRNTVLRRNAVYAIEVFPGGCIPSDAKALLAAGVRSEGWPLCNPHSSH
jgi:hypothetical protein